MKWIELNLEILSSTTADSQRQFSAYSLFNFENKRQKIKIAERFYKHRAVQPWLQPLLLQRARGFGFTQNPQMKSSEPSYIRGPRNLLTLDKIYMCLPAGFFSVCMCVCMCFSAQIDYLIDRLTHLHDNKLLSLQENSVRINLVHVVTSVEEVFHRPPAWRWADEKADQKRWWFMAVSDCRFMLLHAAFIWPRKFGKLSGLAADETMEAKDFPRLQSNPDTVTECTLTLKGNKNKTVRILWQFE